LIPVGEIDLDGLLAGVRGHKDPELNVLPGLAPVEAGLLLLLALRLLLGI
jgi:hypothetical protein